MHILCVKLSEKADLMDVGIMSYVSSGLEYEKLCTPFTHRIVNYCVFCLCLNNFRAK